MPSYPAGITVSNHALITVSDALRHRRTLVGTRWRRLSAGQQALLVVAYLRKGETQPPLPALRRVEASSSDSLAPRTETVIAALVSPTSTLAFDIR